MKIIENKNSFDVKISNINVDNEVKTYIFKSKVDTELSPFEFEFLKLNPIFARMIDSGFMKVKRPKKKKEENKDKDVSDKVEIDSSGEEK